MIEKRYEMRNLVGRGNFSEVYLAMDRKTYKNVAIKVMKTHECIAYKQACILKRFNHPNIASLIDFQQDIRQKSSKLVIEYLPKNALELYQENKNGLSEEQIKCILFQTALGLAYVHSKGYIHRDIKPENILINKDTAEVKIIDFGLAVSGQCINTDYVATRWYRAPQNLLTTRQYTCAIDVFSLGCVIVEMYLGQPLFPGVDNIDQINLIHKVFGQPTKQNWKKGYENLQKLKLKNNIKIHEKENNNKYIQNIFKSCSQKLINLIKRMLIMNPKNRISCRQIIMDNYFNNIKEIIPKNIYQRYKNDNNKNQNNQIKYSQRYKSYNNIYQAIQYQQQLQQKNKKNQNKQILLRTSNNDEKIRNKNNYHRNNHHHHQQQRISIINKQYQGKTNRLQQSKSLQQINIHSKCKVDSYHHYSIHNQNQNYINNSNQNQNNLNYQNNSNESGEKLTFRRVNQIRKPKIQVDNNKAKYSKFIDKQISLEEKEKNNSGQIKNLRQPFKGIKEQNKKCQLDYGKQYKRNIKGQRNSYNNKLIKSDKDLIANYQSFATPEIMMKSSELSSSQKKIDLKDRKGGQQQMKIDRQVVKISQRYITNNDKSNLSNGSNCKINYLPDIKEQQDSKDNNDRLYKGVKVSNQGQLIKKQPKLKVTVVKNSMKNYNNSPKQFDKYMIRKEHLYKSTDLMKYKKIEQQKKIDDNNHNNNNNNNNNHNNNHNNNNHNNNNHNNNKNNHNILNSQIDTSYQIDDRQKKSQLIIKQKQIPEIKTNRIKTVKLKKQIIDPILITNNTVYGGQQRVNIYKNRLTEKFNHSNSNNILPSNININLNLNIIEGKKYPLNDHFSHISPSIYREYNNKPSMISMNYKSPPTKKSQHLNLHNLELHQRNK